MELSRQEYWIPQESMPLHSPEDLPDPGIEPVSLASPALAGRFFATSTICEAHAWVMATILDTGLTPLLL